MRDLPDARGPWRAGSPFGMHIMAVIAHSLLGDPGTAAAWAAATGVVDNGFSGLVGDDDRSGPLRTAQSMRPVTAASASEIVGNLALGHRKCPAYRRSIPGADGTRFDSREERVIPGYRNP